MLRVKGILVQSSFHSLQRHSPASVPSSGYVHKTLLLMMRIRRTMRITIMRGKLIVDIVCRREWTAWIWNEMIVNVALPQCQWNNASCMPPCLAATTIWWHIHTSTHTLSHILWLSPSLSLSAWFGIDVIVILWLLPADYDYSLIVWREIAKRPNIPPHPTLPLSPLSTKHFASFRIVLWQIMSCVSSSHPSVAVLKLKWCEKTTIQHLLGTKQEVPAKASNKYLFISLLFLL